MTWSKTAKALWWGTRWNVITFRQGHWWAIDMTGAERGPISRRDAYLVAVSYMDAADVAAHEAEAARLELDAMAPQVAAGRRRGKLVQAAYRVRA